MNRIRFLLPLSLIAFGLVRLASGLAFDAPTRDLALAPADVTTLGADADDQLAARVATGDFNGDGIDDLLLGADQADAAGNARARAGEAYVIFGSSTLSGTTDLAASASDLTVFGANPCDNLSVGLAAGDFNGDGIDDLLLGADQGCGGGQGRAYVIFGSPTLSGTRDIAASAQDFTVLGATFGDRMTHAVGAGDFNGDGIDDLLLGAFGGNAAGEAKPGAGEAYVIFGSTTLSGTKDIAASAQDLTVFGADAGDGLGIAVAAGDFNGDGIDDLLLGAFGADAVGNAKSSAGEAYVFFGSPTLGGTRDLAASAQNLTVLGADAGDNLGQSLGAGDLNGDGTADPLVGAFEADAAGNAKAGAGEAYVVFGSPTLSGTRDIAASAQDLTVLGADAGDNLGVSVAAGDFNGDGIADLVPGAFFADAAGNAKADAGEAYVFFGSATLSGTKDAANPQNFTVLGADAGDRLGLKAAAGDVNGDSIDDLLVGADLADAAGNAKPNAGEAYVIFGRCASGTADFDSDGLCNPFDPDDDNDGVLDGPDNCDFLPNPGQQDNDGDTLGDVCDPDDDNDTVPDGSDNCVFTPNSGQANNDSDTLGDACDPDDDNDGVNDTSDNCPFAGNPAQLDLDLDGLGNACDPDIDNDGIPNASDPDDDNDEKPDATDSCPYQPEDYDGFEDADGCPDTDNDSDGVPDTLDIGQMAFYPPGHDHSAPTVDCRNTPEDFDGFKDSDGCPDPDNDNDGKPDSNDTCPGNDNLAGPDGALGVGGDNNHNGLVDDGETWAPLGTSGNDDSVRTYEDYDGILDTDGCHDSPCDDVDGDSFGQLIQVSPGVFCTLFADEREAQLGTNSLRACAATATPDDEAMDPYPLDTNDDGFTDITDVSAVTGRFGETQTPSNVRYELNLDGFIDISDISLMIGRFGQACVPPGPMG